MIVILKKRNAFLIAAIFFLSVYIAGAIVNSFAFSRRVSLSCYGKKIVLDAGHGEPDGGAVGKTGVKEQELNLKIAKILQGFLEQCGMEVVMTRADEQGIYDSDGTIRQKKRSDMTNREKLMNNSGADMFLSIHMNKFTDSKYSGPQVFYSPDDESKELAQILQDELIAVLHPESQREIKKATNDIYLLKKAQIPAALIECGFLSNDDEEEKLKDDEYQKKIAWAIYCGIIKYFSLKAS